MNAEACRRHGRRSASSGVPGVAPVRAFGPWPRQYSNAPLVGPNHAPQPSARARRGSAAAMVEDDVAWSLPDDARVAQAMRLVTGHLLVPLAHGMMAGNVIPTQRRRVQDRRRQAAGLSG